jgi:phosphoribosylformimino-5-aminoimidazole carboxamide ribotide isomerase
MRIIPVIDLQSGQVVRGVGGRRHEYQPIVSCLTRSSEPVEVARAFRDRLGLSELYLADLDAIAGAPPALATYAAIKALGCRLWVDAGLRDETSAAPLLHVGLEGIVAGLETIGSPRVLQRLLEEAGAERTVFSLDMKQGKPLGDLSGWRAPDVWSIATHAIEMGVRRLIILDLSRVGGGQGTGTEDFCRELTARYADVELIAGGGVRDRGDLQRLRQCGARAVLVASALHDGRLRREDLLM